MDVQREDVLDLARSQVGYKEGKNNYNIYAKQLDSVKYYAPQKKQNTEWCAVFIDYLFYMQIKDVKKCHEFMHEPAYNTLSAGAKHMQNYFKKAHAYTKTLPQPGYVAFFGDPAKHVGIVLEVGSTTVTTIEGNHGNKVSRVVRKKSEISGYGIVKYSDKKPTGGTCNVELRVLKQGMSGEDVKSMQTLLKQKGYKGKGKVLAIDGDFGPASDDSLRAFQKANKLEVDGYCGPATWSKLLKG